METMKAKNYRLRQLDWELQRTYGDEKRNLLRKRRELADQMSRRHKGIVLPMEFTHKGALRAKTDMY